MNTERRITELNDTLSLRQAYEVVSNEINTLISTDVLARRTKTLGEMYEMGRFIFDIEQMGTHLN